MSSWGWNLSPVDASLGTPLGKPAREEISLGKAKPGVGKLVTSEQESNTGTLSWEDPSLRVELPNPIQISVGNNSRTLPPQTMHCCCCLDESSRHHPGLFFPHPPFQALFRGPGRCCSSQLGALGKNFPSTFPVPGKNTEGSRREVSLKPAGSTRGGLFGNVAPRRECQLFIPVTRGTELGSSWLLRLHTRKCGLAGKPKPGLEARMGKTISVCFPGMRMNMRARDLWQG